MRRRSRIWIYKIIWVLFIDQKWSFRIIVYDTNPHLTVVEADICAHEKIDLLFVGVDWVFHMAALVDILSSIQKLGVSAYMRRGCDLSVWSL